MQQQLRKQQEHNGAETTHNQSQPVRTERKKQSKMRKDVF
jgi:hypothetical protein